MTKVAEKMGQLIQKLAAGEDVRVEVNMATGDIRISGVEFAADEQLEIMKEFGNDPTMAKLIAQVASTPAAEEIRNSVSYSAGKFEVDADRIGETLGYKLASALHTTPKGVKVEVKDAKDREIEELKEKVKFLESQIVLHEKDLTFPRDFFNAYDNVTGQEHVHELEDSEIQLMVDSLKTLEVPEGSFVVARTGDTVVVKLNSGGDEGIDYIVSRDYYEATVE